MNQADVVDWLTKQVRDQVSGPVSMGVLEKAVEQVSRECRRQAIQLLAQEAVAAQPLECPGCGSRLNVEAYGRVRCVESEVGRLEIRRDYGFCVPCGTHAYPADVVLGLHPRATGSPRVQELCASTNGVRLPQGGPSLRNAIMSPRARDWIPFACNCTPRPFCADYPRPNTFWS